MCIRDRINNLTNVVETASAGLVKIGEKSDMMSEEVRVAIEKMNTIEPSVMAQLTEQQEKSAILNSELTPVSYTHLRAHETKANLVCRLLLEKKKKKKKKKKSEEKLKKTKRTTQNTINEKNNE